MTANIHRALMAIGSFCVGLAGVAGGSDTIDPQIMSWVALGGAVVIFGANIFRQYWPESTNTP